MFNPKADNYPVFILLIMNQIEEIKSLKALLDQGAISEKEFAVLKERLFNASSVDSKPVNEKVNAYQEGTGTTANLAKAGLAAAVLLSIVLWIRYDSFWLFIISAVILISVLLSIGKLTSKVSGRNVYFGMFIATCTILMAVPIGRSSSTPSAPSVQNIENVSNDDDKYVRDYIISHEFTDNENGVAFTLEFSEGNGGWFGIMTMRMGDCWFLYQYETAGRSIQLTFDSSNCTSQGSSATASFNSDNSISLNYRGEEFIFEPM